MNIGYYAHSDGSGHIKSALKIKNCFKEHNVFIFCDDDLNIEDENIIGLTPETLESYEREDFQVSHLKVKNDPFNRKRYFTFLKEYIVKNLQFLIIDVSTELALFCHSVGIPYAYNYLHGDRNDLPHQIAFDNAKFLVSYVPCILSPRMSYRHFKKTFFIFDKFNLPIDVIAHNIQYRRVVIITGKGHCELLKAQILKFSAMFPNYEYVCFGNDIPINFVKNCGFVEDPLSFINTDDIVIAVCGLNLSIELIKRKIPFISAPQKRYFNEQNEFVTVLQHAGLTINIDKLHSSDTVYNFLKNYTSNFDKFYSQYAYNTMTFNDFEKKIIVI